MQQNTITWVCSVCGAQNRLDNIVCQECQARHGQNQSGGQKLTKRTRVIKLETGLTGPQIDTPVRAGVMALNWDQPAIMDLPPRDPQQGISIPSIIWYLLGTFVLCMIGVVIFTLLR